MSNRYELLRLRQTNDGIWFYEIADLRTGVIYWTKELPK